MSISAISAAQTVQHARTPERLEGPGPDHDGDKDDRSAAPAPGTGTVVDKHA